jgi:hypothetical protein
MSSRRYVKPNGESEGLIVPFHFASPMTDSNDLVHRVSTGPSHAREVSFFVPLEREPAMHSLLASQRGRADEVRNLARRGMLAETVAKATVPERLRLTGGTYDIAWPVVFSRLTQGLERRRGHASCATSVRHLADDCLDRFEDDVEAVVHDVIRFARRPIENLEAWIASRIKTATVDGYRRRRGEIGALQRPRPPAWLMQALDGDAWLVDLATQILGWVGNPATAGAELWPTESWAVRRCQHTGDWSTNDPAAVRRAKERVHAPKR